MKVPAADPRLAKKKIRNTRITPFFHHMEKWGYVFAHRFEIGYLGFSDIGFHDADHHAGTYRRLREVNGAARNAASMESG